MTSDLDSYRAAAPFDRGLPYGADSRVRVIGIILELDEATNRALVSVNNGVGSWAPYNPAAVWDGVRTAHVLRDPFTGRVELVLCPAEDPVPEPEPLPQPPPPPPPAGVVTLEALVVPQWSGSYRAGSGWDRWNVGRYGGRTTLYQGSGFGSGLMKGLVTYGEQLVNLAALTITGIEVALRGVGLSGASGPATVQGSPHASQPGGSPSSSGDTATGDGLVAVTPGMCEAFRTGAAKGFALVGGNYWAVAGAGNGDGMVLHVTYTRPA